MDRRALLTATSRAALGAALPGLLPSPSRAVTLASPPGLQGLILDLEKRIPQLMARHRLPGLSLTLVREGHLAWGGAFGVQDAASRRPVDAATVFEAQSMSKPVFAYVVLKLCEKGVLGLDTPLTRYGPAPLPPGDARVDLVTARRVLSHTSGLPNWRSGQRALALGFEPGARFSYSGEGYAWLQSVVTRLTGRVDERTCGTYEGDLKVCASDIAEYLNGRLLAPFGMTSSAYVWSTALGERTARRHDEKGTPLPERRSTAQDAARYASSGGLLTTASDYARFLVEIVSPRPPDDFRLGPDSLREMLRPAVKVSDDPGSGSWSLGWQIFETPRGRVIAHGGDNPGTHCFAAASPERRSGFVVMTNGTGGMEVLKEMALGEAMPPLLGL